jgi:hypothetical protein
MQIDIGFGDVMTPGPETLSGNSRETVVAEKLQALVQLRMLNTRMKDYFDLWLLTRQPQLNKEVLGVAIKRTFPNRGMEIDAAPIGLSPAFGGDPAKQMQWSAFLKRGGRLTEAPRSLSEVVEELHRFFATILSQFRETVQAGQKTESSFAGWSHLLLTRDDFAFHDVPCLIL